MSKSIETIPIPTIPNLSSFDNQAFEGLSDVPAVIVGFDRMGDNPVGVDCVRQTKAVGARLVELAGGEFEFESEGLPVLTGVPEHVDGFTDRYWQLNTAWGGGPGLLLSRPGTDYVINVYNLDQPLEGELFSKIVKRGHDPASQKSTFYFRTVPEHGRTGILSVLLEEGKCPPTLVKSYRGFVPLCSTIVFVNGTGFEGTLITHTTKSAYLDRNREVKPTNHLRRQAATGRVVVPDGQPVPKSLIC